jgi:acetyl esterase
MNEPSARAHPSVAAELAQEVRALLAEMKAERDLYGVPTESSIVAQRISQLHRRSLGSIVDPAQLAKIEDHVVEVEGGSIVARVYTPREKGPHPLHIFFHGGGFLFGSSADDSTDLLMRGRAAVTNSVVVSVDYRLAPEHRFPTAVEDGYAALLWAVRHARDLDGDPSLVSVGGVSAGGNIAAVVAIMARDRSGPSLVLQLLEIPGLDMTKSSHGWRHSAPGHDISRTEDLAMATFYLRTAADAVNPHVSPLMAADLTGLPPAYVISAEHDPRRDESEAYVARLKDAGVHAMARTMPGHVHASMLLVDAWEPARAWAAEANAVIRRANMTTREINFELFTHEPIEF